MKNRLIPRSEWSSFFDAFTRRHVGWLATVWVVDPRLGAQVEARGLPFEAVDLDPSAQGPISLQLGALPASNIEHRIDEPEQVWVELTDGGTEAALEVRSRGERKTIVEFRVPIAQEAVDPAIYCE
jgi:Family of unknown function (DUF5335)